MACISGEIIHTNEIMVLLGDNWFLETSSFRANEIINRRREWIIKERIKLENELLNLRSDMLTLSGHVMNEENLHIKEIKEEYICDQKSDYSDYEESCITRIPFNLRDDNSEAMANIEDKTSSTINGSESTHIKESPPSVDNVPRTVSFSGIDLPKKSEVKRGNNTDNMKTIKGAVIEHDSTDDDDSISDINDDLIKVRLEYEKMKSKFQQLHLEQSSPNDNALNTIPTIQRKKDS